MDHRFVAVAALAVANHSVVSLGDLERVGVSATMRSRWVASGRLVRLGPRSFAVGGAAATWLQSCASALADVAGHGVLAGRAAARLHRLDGFESAPVEVLVPAAHRGHTTPYRTVATCRAIPRDDVMLIEGLRVLRAERLIVDAPLFAFSRKEIENAIDSALRLRLLSEQRLRDRVSREHRRSINGSRVLLDALVDTGGESRLERMFLGLVRAAGLPRPRAQQTFRMDGRSVARVDFVFPGGLIVEVAGHATHATRRQRQVDAQRTTELTLKGGRVLTFTYDDVHHRPSWVVAQLRRALSLAA